jgi:16S rRNA processing protein RimM
VDAWDGWLLVGHIARPHGHRGQVIVNPKTDFAAERFRSGRTVWMLKDGVPAPIGIREARIHKGRPVLTLDGIASMNDALKLHGVELRVPPDEQVGLPKGAFYHHDLVGCVLSTVDGRVVGTVRAVEGAAGSQWLVATDGAREVLVPLASAICVEIDVEGKRIVVDPPDGLLELNA